tara:strand:- start:17835 stop:18257 length:423 start_codon:yes stop_codon:yes gene_type:complete
MKTKKQNKWLCQYLKDENMYYLTEHHPEDGILGEDFFYTFSDLEEFVTKNKIPVFLPENVNIGDITNAHEFFLGEQNITEFDFKSFVSMYSGDLKGRMFKAQYKMTLELIRHAPEEALGAMLKKMLKDLDEHIKKERNHG